MGSCNQQSRLGVLCIAACVSVCILLAVPTVLCFATRVSVVEEEEGARGGGGGGAAAAATAIIQEKPLPFIVLHGKEVSSVSLPLSLSVALCVCVSSPSCTAEGMCDNSIVRLFCFCENKEKMGWELTKLEGR